MSDGKYTDRWIDIPDDRPFGFCGKDGVAVEVVAARMEACVLALQGVDNPAEFVARAKALVESVRQAQKDKCNGFDTLADAEWDHITRLANDLRTALETNP